MIEVIERKHALSIEKSKISIVIGFKEYGEFALRESVN